MLIFEIAFLVVAALMLVVDIIFLLSTLFSGPWKSEEWRRKEREYRKKQKKQLPHRLSLLHRKQ